MKFDYCIGNPPYQQENALSHRQEPVYDKFMETAYSISDCAEFITPARFLFDAGQTSKEWNKKMLNDEHFKVSYYEQDSDKVFPGLSTPIKGGVAITIRDARKNYGAIKRFTTQPQIANILQRVLDNKITPFSNIVFPKSTFSLTDEIYKEHPELVGKMTKGNEYIVDAKIFEKMESAFSDKPMKDSVKILGRDKTGRIYKYIHKRYIKDIDNLRKWKVIIAGVNGAGTLGETLSEPIIEGPYVCHTQTFMSIGIFDTELEADNCLKYIKGKFARLLLHTLKVTQNNAKETWRNIPLQDFTDKSDIDWTKSIHEIDLQLYKKYNLSQEEIEFIESHVKEME